jgi:hypothetical protein
MPQELTLSYPGVAGEAIPDSFMVVKFKVVYQPSISSNDNKRQQVVALSPEAGPI